MKFILRKNCLTAVIPIIIGISKAAELTALRFEIYNYI